MLENEVIKFNDTDYFDDSLKAFKAVSKDIFPQLERIEKDINYAYLLLRDDGRKDIIRNLISIKRYFHSICYGEIDLIYDENDLFVLVGRKSNFILPKKFKVYSKSYEWQVELVPKIFEIKL